MVSETVLVTGGCGFVGGRLVAALRGDGHSVRVLDIPRADFSAVEALGAKCHEGSAVDGESVRAALGSSRVVYHMAAPPLAIEDRAYLRKMVVAGAQVLMEELEGSRVEAVVAASTTGVYARSGGVRREGDPLRPGNELERAKLEMERSLERWGDRVGVSTACLRLPNVYGRGDGTIVDSLLEEVAIGAEVSLPQKGWVSTVHVDDVVAAARGVAAAVRDGGDVAFRALNCVDSKPHAPSELVEVLADHLDVRTPSVRPAGGLLRATSRWSDRNRSVRLVDPNRFSNQLLSSMLEDWPARPTLEDGLLAELGGPG